MNILISLVAAAALLTNLKGTDGNKAINTPVIYKEGDNPVAESMLKKNLQRAGINTHIYEFFDPVVTPAPKGFKPVYISYYGRHGTRSDNWMKQYTYVTDILHKADSLGILTGAGDTLLAGAEVVRSAHNDMNGRLLPHGQKEQYMLASRLYRRYPSVFKKGSRYVRAESSTAPRCIVTMACFMARLSSIQPSLQYSMDTGEKYMAVISNTCSPEHKAATQKMLDSLTRSTANDTVQIFRTLFTDPVKGKSLVRNIDIFQRNIWLVARISQASGFEYDLFKYLPFNVIYRWWDFYNRELYIRHGNSFEFGAERMKATMPLVRDILIKADAALAGNDIAADLKFGHDYPIMAMAGYFGLNGVGDRMSFDEIPYKWNDFNNVTFSSNLQIIFFRNRLGSVLVKFVYNDIERQLAGLVPFEGNYYRWEDVKTKFL